MSEKDYRRAKMTPEAFADAERLKKLWDAYKKTGEYLGQEAFGDAYQIGSQSAMTLFLNGKTPLSLKAARGFAKGLACKIEDFSPSLAAQAAQIGEVASESSDAEFQDVPRINVRLAAGDGSVEGFEEVIGSLKFASSFLRDVRVSPAKARIVSVRGHSMHPVIPDGAVVLVNTSDAAREPVHGEVFAIVRPVEGLSVKRLKFENGHWLATSDNPAGPTIPINDGEPAKIIGRAVWMGTKL